MSIDDEACFTFPSNLSSFQLGTTGSEVGNGLPAIDFPVQPAVLDFKFEDFYDQPVWIDTSPTGTSPTHTLSDTLSPTLNDQPSTAPTPAASTPSPSGSTQKTTASNRASLAPPTKDQGPPPQHDETWKCKLCDYRPRGDPKWFHGSMAKHMKLQHSKDPPVIYRCLYPGCTSEYKNRADNLRQHQIDKNHFVDGEEAVARRPKKRKSSPS